MANAMLEILDGSRFPLYEFWWTSIRTSEVHGDFDEFWMGVTEYW